MAPCLCFQLMKLKPIEEAGSPIVGVIPQLKSIDPHQCQFLTFLWAILHQSIKDVSMLPDSRLTKGSRSAPALGAVYKPRGQNFVQF